MMILGKVGINVTGRISEPSRQNVRFDLYGKFKSDRRTLNAVKCQKVLLFGFTGFC